MAKGPNLVLVLRAQWLFPPRLIASYDVCVRLLCLCKADLGSVDLEPPPATLCSPEVRNHC